VERILGSGTASFSATSFRNSAQCPKQNQSNFFFKLLQTIAALDDPNKEVDLDMATRKMEELIGQTVKVRFLFFGGAE